ncbi:MAG: hypothetical protein O2958_02665 [Gemmatimonadetes bacterium]|nr:hypothetical protein [Gemmatimonadota bacterium]MDA1101991.1 hypothetical protein [Gemmatimonadota bacterium]
MNLPEQAPGPETDFRRTLIRVLVTQVVALALLGLLQLRYHV